MFARLFGKRTSAAPPSTGGRLVYAVGDVHGRADLLSTLVHAEIDGHRLLLPHRRHLGL